MASITTYLNKIKSAVYGKDVRQSIYDSINAINTQVNTYTSAEESRVSAEQSRADAESLRQNAEADRETAETERADAETAREDAETARTEEYTELKNTMRNLLSDLQGALDNITDHAYPIGSLYITSTSEFIPDEYFGGTWRLVDENALASIVGGTIYMWERLE